MTKATELRIGNFIMSNHGEVTVEILGDLPYPNDIYTSPNIIHARRGAGYRGIPLTEEWLLKLGGMEVLNTGISFLLNGIMVVVSDDKIVIQSKYSKSGSLVLPRENYNQVHLFQNLVFALTGEELTTI